MLKTFFFVYIGLSMRIDGWTPLLVGLGLTLALYLVRIPVVRLTLASNTSQGDAMVCAVMVPKGLAAAVVATFPAQMGLPGAEMIQNTTYSVVFFSILLTSVLVFLLERHRLDGISARIFPGQLPHGGPTPS